MLNKKSKPKNISRTSKPKNISRTSKLICIQSKNLLKSIADIKIYNEYEKYIKSVINKLVVSKSLLINNIFNISLKKDYIITYKETYLDTYTIIPPVINIFRYLLLKPELFNLFTLSEKSLLNKEFLLDNTNISNDNIISQFSNIQKSKIYNFLDNSPLGKKLLSIYYSFSEDNIKKNELYEKYPSLVFHSLLINSFTSFKIIEDLELNIKKVICISVKWQNKNYENLVYLFMYDKTMIYSDMKEKEKEKENHKQKHTTIKNNTYLNKINNEIISRILFFNTFLNIDTMPDKFIFFLTNNKKEIDNNLMDTMHFKTININTAVTNGHDIIIYREQELLKSIFHELIHFHNLDFKTIPTDIIDYLIKTHNINKDNQYLLYECITETLTNILNNIFLSSNIKEFSINLKNEILFSTLQVFKILNLCGYKKWDAFALLDDKTASRYSNNNSNSKTQFKQDSCVFSYYILKLYILLNIDTYFEKCIDNKLTFIKTTIGINNLKTIFNNARYNIQLKNIIDNMLNKTSQTSKVSQTSKTSKTPIKSNKYIGKISKNTISKINKTLRMTCLDNTLFHKNSI